MVVDIIIIAFLALSIFLGYKKGLIELGIKLIAFIIALVATVILYRPISNFVINNTKIDENLQEFIMEKSANVVKEEETKNDTNTMQNEITSEVKNQILPNAAHELALNIVRAGVMVILYIVIRIAIGFITALANLIAKLPILKQFNEVGGAIFGALRGIILVYVVLLVIQFVSEVNPGNRVNKEIEGSFIGKELYHRNVIELLIK